MVCDFFFLFCHTDNVIKSQKKTYSLLLEVILVKQHMTGGFAKSAILPQDLASVVKNTHGVTFLNKPGCQLFLHTFFSSLVEMCQSQREHVYVKRRGRKVCHLSIEETLKGKS